MAAYDANGYTGKYASCAAGCTSAIVAGLTNNVPYAILVYAHNVNGWGIAAVSNLVTPVGPAATA